MLEENRVVRITPVEMVSDTELVEYLRELLSTSDLKTTTTRIILRKLEEDLGIDLSDRKAFIREQIDLYFQILVENEEKMESSNGKISWSLSDGNRKQYKAFDCGAPGVMRRQSALSLSSSSSFSVPSNGHINDFGLSESTPLAKNISTSNHVVNDTLETQNQQHESYGQREECRVKICRKMSRSSIKVCEIAQEDSSGSKQPCKKQKITTTIPAQPTPSSPAHRIDEQSSDVSSDKEEDDVGIRALHPTDESDDKESKDEVEEEADEEDSDGQQLPPEENLKGPSNGHINDFGLSESMPPVKNVSTSNHVDNCTLGTQNQQHESYIQHDEHREKSRRKMSRSSIKACKIAQENGSGSNQPCKKQNITTTTPAQPTPLSPAHSDEQSLDDSSDKEEGESDHKESKDEAEEEVDVEDSDELQLPPEENLKVQDPWKSGVNRKASKNVPLAATVTDQDVFDCPVCFEKLTNIVFQCKNGHVACDSCCVKINTTCPTCLCPIEYRCRAFEKVLEAIQVPCVNAEHGCRQVISYSKMRDHEDLCAYLTCSCPIRKCDFKGAGSNLYRHFDEKHMEKAVIFRFRYRVSVSITREKKHIVLREKTSGTLFVVKLFSVPQGKVISVVLIGPKSYSGNYRYELTAKDDGVTPPIAMQSPVESVPRLADYRPTRNFVVVEDGIPQLNFDICIRSNQ